MSWFSAYIHSHLRKPKIIVKQIKRPLSLYLTSTRTLSIVVWVVHLLVGPIAELYDAIVWFKTFCSDLHMKMTHIPVFGSPRDVCGARPPSCMWSTSHPMNRLCVCVCVFISDFKMRSHRVVCSDFVRCRGQSSKKALYLHCAIRRWCSTSYCVYEIEHQANTRSILWNVFANVSKQSKFRPTIYSSITIFID